MNSLDLIKRQNAPRGAIVNSAAAVVTDPCVAAHASAIITSCCVITGLAVVDVNGRHVRWQVSKILPQKTAAKMLI